MAGESGPRWRKRTARFDEIAALAGVSTTTVDRVLNERGSVSAQARERVVAAEFARMQRMPPHFRQRVRERLALVLAQHARDFRLAARHQHDV
ncbi:LacI family DNA-binding transcriptional regulator, partial [Burkholderia sp. Ac-20384]|uniref:LacI family DNA-binding transcriptional regulator n=1 Tax=Burkholderia sp. Ac-20384 TaxID=2703902 RepID=UPI001F11F190